jgi:hypothetical protein
VNGAFVAARNMLTPNLKRKYSAPELKGRMASMIAYANEPIDNFEVVGMMENWPTKKARDAGWVYVALLGNGFSEAVTIIIARQASKLLIRDIEWGRP